MKKYALLSVSDKTGIVKFARFLLDRKFIITSTGGTFKKLSDSFNDIEKQNLVQVSDLTKFPEIMGGRVKTLHPTIAGGILSNRYIQSHITEMKRHDIPHIDVVVCNLYPFNKVGKTTNVKDAVELIDIGGVTLLRSAAKNFKHVLPICDVNDYDLLVKDWETVYANEDQRRKLAVKTFRHTAMYDGMILDYMSDSEYTSRIYKKEIPLKYGCNPHQKNAHVYSVNNGTDCNTVNEKFPFKLLNGKLGYINILDALGCWGIVSDAKKCFPNSVAATSFKHTSPAGAAISVPLSDVLKKVYFLENMDTSTLSDASIAYIRARNSDPMSSFGDFIGINAIVDQQLAKLIKREVSDGIVAPGYTAKALEILSSKKGGNYVILEASRPVVDSANTMNNIEFREIGGVVVSQDTNQHLFSVQDFDSMKCDTQKKELSDAVKRDLLFGNIVLKYSQSNNVLCVKDGQTIGISAGQQSRIHSTKLAVEKSKVWLLRQHPKTLKLMECFKAKTKKQTKINAIIQFIENQFTTHSFKDWSLLFDDAKTLPEFISEKEQREFLDAIENISMTSDAFFPFRDSIDVASLCKVQYILQPGGSVRDGDVVKACDDYGITMVCSGVRVFTH